MYRVHLIPTPHSPHLSQVIGGLSMLQGARQIALQVLQAPTGKTIQPVQHLLWAEVEKGSHTRLVCFDMLDGVDFDPALVAHADVYFKRAYRAEEHAHLTNIKPYGLNYACSSNRPRDDEKILAALQFQSRSLKRRVGRVASTLGFVSNSATRPFRAKAFERSAHTAANAGVIFVTRLWDTGDVPGYDHNALEAVNHSRLNLVRALRTELGPRFFGGLENNETARKRSPDLVVQGSQKDNYLAQMHKQLIGVATAGLHGSTGWKFAEYVAAARCIVSEPMQHLTPSGTLERMQADKNYLVFNDPQECVAACQQLLSDPDTATNMRKANQRYYETAMRPDVLLQRCLEESFA